MASNVSSSNPLGLEPSELAAAKRAKEAAAARAVATPVITQSAKLTEPDAPAVATESDRGTPAPVATPSSPAKPKSTNEKIADTIAAYVADHPAPKGTHYGTTLGADGNPILYKDAAPIGGLGTGGGSGTGASPVTPAGDSATVTALQKQVADLTSQVNTTAAATQAALNASRQNAITFLTSTFNDLGLGADIASAVTNLVQQGYTADTIQMIAQDPKSKDPLSVAFKARFPANEARMNAGLPVLSPKDYIDTERSYAQVLQSYGLPADFASNKDVFTKLLTNDVSPTELNSRANIAKQVIENTDPLITQQLQQYYGLSQGQMIAHVLDPAVATPIIQKQVTASQLGAEAARAGANINQAYAEQLGGLGVTQAQANAGFQNIAQSQQGMQELATRYDAYGPAGQVGQQLQAATFGTTGAAAATAELNRLKQQEVSQFSGSSGAGKGSLMGTEAGLS
jgi:hypothetical protein